MLYPSTQTPIPEAPVSSTDPYFAEAVIDVNGIKHVPVPTLIEAVAEAARKHGLCADGVNEFFSWFDIVPDRTVRVEVELLQPIRFTMRTRYTDVTDHSAVALDRELRLAIERWAEGQSAVEWVEDVIVDTNFLEIDQL